ncbi:transmembrane protein 231 isoform X1 [Hydra vulgaris]|uniref:transmembrane protein 231 isoform X1 n=1 Tax=Hydra vulgaris TaxID=6087 RepID=UPI000640BDB5|nr:transmembrane protein 231 [Hydra vulgaris]
MVMFVVHHESVKNCYRAHFCSMALWFFISVALITYIVPLFLAYQSHGFWIKEHTYREQPEVHFKHEFVLFLQTTGKLIGYSTIENLNTVLLGENTRFPIVRSYEVDQNLDGKNDFMKFEVQTPVLDNELIQSIQLLLFFDYRLYTYSNLQMESLAFISFQTCIPGSEFKSNGVLKFVQKYPLPHRGSLTKYDVPIIDSTSQNILDFDLHNILSSYQTRNISTTFVGSYPVWRGQPSASVPFSVKLHIEYPEETIIYHPGFWQLIKFAWIQYLSILLVFIYFFHKVKTFVYKNQIFDSTLTSTKVHQD